MRRRSSVFTSFSFVCNLLRIVCRSTVNRPLLLFFPQICVKPRKLNVSGFPSPRHFRWSIAYGPNSRRRVFSGCSSRVNFRNRSVSSARNCSASALLKSHHDVVSESHHDHIAVRSLLTPCLDPQVEHVVKIDVRQKRRSTATLRRPFLHPHSFPILQHAGVQPFLDEPHDAPVCDPVLDELHQPFVGKPIEKTFDVKIEHPVHLSRQQSGVERIQRLMLASPWSEPVRESEKVRFVDGVQHLDRRHAGRFCLPAP